MTSTMAPPKTKRVPPEAPGGDPYEIVSQLIAGPTQEPTYPSFMPAGPGKAYPTGIAPGDLPKTINELIIQLSRTYDLSVTAAAQLNIPVIGSVSGGFSRRVLVLERTAYKPMTDSGIEYQFGYAIRLVITVNKLTAEAKVTLPFLAASAELGNIEAKWTLQVLGLSGPKIDSVSLPPTELNVETFVLAKQSLANLILAVRDTSTNFSAQQVAIIKPADVVEREYLSAIGKAYALGRLEKGRRLGQAVGELAGARDEIRDSVLDTYKDFAGLTLENEEPLPEVRRNAGRLLGPVRVDSR